MRKKKTKPRGTRSRLTHIEVRRRGVLRLRLVIADDAIAGAGDELGALIKKIAPGAPGALSTSTVESSAVPLGAITSTPEAPSEFIVAPTHTNDDDAYHAQLRDRLGELLSSLCDASLADALEIARTEQARRSEMN